jgi:hypothetical protein
MAFGKGVGHSAEPLEARAVESYQP